jgi:hypothetical protein
MSLSSFPGGSNSRLMQGFSFTPLDLERALVQEVTAWINNPPILCRDPYNPEDAPVPPTVYQGRIPSLQAGPQETPTYKAPSIAVCCTRMRYRRESGIATVTFAILTWNDQLDRRGYMDVSNIINRIISRLYETGIIAESFVLLDEAVQGELIFDPSVDFFGYFLGAVEASFGLMTPGINEGPLYGSDDFLVQ